MIMDQRHDRQNSYVNFNESLIHDFYNNYNLHNQRRFVAVLKFKWYLHN